MSEAEENKVHYQTEGPVAVATIDAPRARNSMGAPGIRAGLIEAIAAFEADPALRVFILTGAGPVFSAGGDLRALREIRDRAGMEARIAGADGLIGTILRSPKLYMAAVEGPAFGAALGLVAGADHVVAAEGARFCAAQARVGAAPDGGLFWALPLRVGRAAARRMLMTGEEVDLPRAVALGLVDETAPEGGALAAARARALRLAAGAPLPQATVKRFFAEGPTEMGEVLAWEREAAVDAFLSEDFLEGANAFLEKRRPEFKGR